MRTSPIDMYITEITVMSQGRKVWLTYRTSVVDHNQKRERLETRMVKMEMPVPITVTEAARLAGVMANYVIPPEVRHVKPPKALVWREVAFGNDVTHDHGTDVDDRQMPMDPLPLEGGFPGPEKQATILEGPKGQGKSAPRSGSDSAREPVLRQLGKGRKQSLPGG